ncbi:MAG TPA: sensor histidine kinase [Lacunisphaera sp.]|nr:sensor histidine kinase [Lacunisphaera sp.]
MNLNTRSLGLALLLLLLFLGAAVTLQWWLRHETRQLQALAVNDLRTRLNLVLAAHGRPPAQWDASFQRELGAMLGGSVEIFAPGHAPRPGPAEAALAFTQELAAAPGWQIRATFPPPAILRVQLLNQRILAIIVLLALLLALVPLFTVLLESRTTLGTDAGTRSPWLAARTQAAGIEQLARLTNERSAALAVEQGARERAEQDLRVNRSLLDKSVGERIRLGRELHDNICQTLYAVCLTLESVQKKGALAPALAQRLDQCMAELRRLNQEVRAFLVDLEPARIHGQSFTGALADMMNAFSAEAGVRFEQKLDGEALAAVPTAQIAEIMNILREAVSNSVRHGRAHTVTLLAGRSEHEVAMAVQDDGVGFTPGAGGAGHGLDNMKVRAAALGGSLRIDSQPGKGTRVLLTLPVASPA